MRFSFKESQPSLCQSCSWAIRTRMARGSTYTKCVSLERMVHGDVAECSEYKQIGAMTKHEMERAAWTIKTGKAGEVIGFKPPEKKGDDYL